MPLRIQGGLLASTLASPGPASPWARPTWAGCWPGLQSPRGCFFFAAEGGTDLCGLSDKRPKCPPVHGPSGCPCCWRVTSGPWEPPRSLATWPCQQAWQLPKQELVFSQFQRPEICDQGVGRSGSFGGLSLARRRPLSCCDLTGPIPLCLCPRPPVRLDEDPPP